MKRIGGLLLAIALAPGLELGLGCDRAAAQQVQASDAETMFWNRVKDTRSAAELRAYLDAFPNGAYADIAKARLQSMASTPPPRPPAAAPVPVPPPITGPGPGTGGPQVPPKTAAPERPAPPSGGGPTSPAPAQPIAGSVLANAAVLREVQERLYNLNYEIGPTGRIDEPTRKAIRDWQTNTNRPVTGDMDAAQLTALRGARLPVTWGAIAYVARGASGAVWNRSSRRDAERDAMAECKKNGGSSCRVVAAADKSCGALGFYQGNVGSTTHWGAYVSVRPTLAQAIDNALTECRAQAKRSDACGVRLQFCADGSHKQ